MFIILLKRFVKQRQEEGGREGRFQTGDRIQFNLSSLDEWLRSELQTDQNLSLGVSPVLLKSPVSNAQPLPCQVIPQ